MGWYDEDKCLGLFGLDISIMTAIFSNFGEV